MSPADNPYSDDFVSIKVNADFKVLERELTLRLLHVKPVAYNDFTLSYKFVDFTIWVSKTVFR